MDVFYRNYLNHLLKERRERYPSYSMRAFARDAGVPVSTLFDVLKGKIRLTPSSAVKIANKLNLRSYDRDLFLTSVELVAARSAEKKTALEIKFKNLYEAKKTFECLDMERFKVVSEWYHFAILELATVKNFQSDPKWIAQRFGLEVDVVQKAMQRLVDLGMAEFRDGVFVQKTLNSRTEGPVPTQWVHDFLTQMLRQAEIGLSSPANRCEYNFTIMSINESCLDEAKKMIREFMRAFSSRFDLSEVLPKERVYALGTQFFSLEDVKQK